MYVIRTLPGFDAWLKGLRDRTAQRRLVARRRKASLGNLGDVKSVGKGVVEMREQSVFITLDRSETEFVGVELTLLECVAYWVRECAYRTDGRATTATTELTVRLNDPESWRTVNDY